MALYFLPMADDAGIVVRREVRRAACATDLPLLLAVSGGLDSMVLLHAMVSIARHRVAAVATFDHGTGGAASAAAVLVADTAAALGLPVVIGHAQGLDARKNGWEAAWRDARHGFLASAATRLGARVATAHTMDDQVETVLMRALRGAGARGLAALESPSPVLRPLLNVRREVLERYARQEGILWMEDPSNTSPRFLRNRVRHDLLPALRRVSPAIDDVLLTAGRAAAAWRAEMEEVVDAAFTTHLDPITGGLLVAREELAGYDRDSLSILWGSLAGRVGLALDRRGTRRLAEFIIHAPGRGSIPLSGGWRLEVRPGAYLLFRVCDAAAPAVLPAAGTLEWGRFRFRSGSVGSLGCATVSWTAALPEHCRITVRKWAAGDRLAAAGGQNARRVTRYLSDAGIHGTDRAGWPVVVACDTRGEEIVWIPGVRRSDAATERSGRPVRHYVCERIAP